MIGAFPNLQPTKLTLSLIGQFALGLPVLEALDEKPRPIVPTFCVLILGKEARERARDADSGCDLQI